MLSFLSVFLFFAAIVHCHCLVLFKLVLFNFSEVSPPHQIFLLVQEMVGCKLNAMKKNSDWLNTLLHNTRFFDSCENHQELRKNEKNVFCIDCNIGFCRHCMSTHRLHQQLQICKYVYHDVVRLQDLQKYFDCSKIQTYKINGEKAVHLNTRPQSKDSKPSTKAKFGSSCEVCKRYLQDPPNSYCSVECKVSNVPLEPIDQSKEIIPLSIQEFPDLCLKEDSNPETSTENESSISLTDMSPESHRRLTAALKARKLFHKRKGVPRRAPLS